AGDGIVVSLTAIPCDCWQFAGWGGDLSGATNPESIVLDRNWNITAVFEQLEYSLTVAADPPEGGTVTGGGVYPCGEIVSVTAIPNSGYRFVRWAGPVTDRSDPSTTAVIDADITVTADFALDQCATLGAVTAEGGAGKVARVPGVLERGALEADRMAFSLQVTANGSAPALGGDLGFEAAAGLPAPGLVSPSGDMISVAWMTPLSAPVSGTVALGDMLVPIAAEALVGDTYSPCMLSVGASLGTEEICVDPGSCATLTVCEEVLAGDVYPELEDLNQDGDACDAGEFGDDDLTWGDVITVFDAWAMPGSFPCEAGTDRFCAMDSYPPDTGEVSGGDGDLTWGDVITTFDRWANPSLPRPWRPLCECAVPALAAEASSAKAALGAAEVAAGPGLWIGDGSGAAGSTVRLPVMLDLGDQEADRMAFSVELAPAEGTEIAAAINGFEAAEGVEEPVVLTMPEGGLGVAWLTPMEAPLSGFVSLGELVIEVPAKAGVGDAWGVYVNAVGASLGDEELDPQVVAGEDALVTVTPGESHDVSIRRFQVPQRAKVGTTRRLTIDVENLTETPELVELRLLRNGDIRQSWLVDLVGQARTHLSVEYTFQHEDRPSVEFAVEAAILEDQEPDDNFAAQIVEVR
ncbi:MAG: hypothetical protein MUQ65_02150, partial [Armatimonadetes bacterium]|nr:hypothetical protein [Armatimonadota bacterium]